MQEIFRPSPEQIINAMNHLDCVVSEMDENFQGCSNPRAQEFMNEFFPLRRENIGLDLDPYLHWRIHDEVTFEPTHGLWARCGIK